MRSATLLFEGAHRVGKGTALLTFAKATSHANSLLDRGWASAYAFGKVFDRTVIDLDLAIHDYFANPTALAVYFALGASDYEIDREADQARKEQWVGMPEFAKADLSEQSETKRFYGYSYYSSYSNRQLDYYIAAAFIRAAKLGYSRRILILTARAYEPAVQSAKILDFVTNAIANLG